MPNLIVTVDSSGRRRTCNARCYNSPACRCRCCCDGKNHGAGLKQAIRNTWEVIAGLPLDEKGFNLVRYKRLVEKLKVNGADINQQDAFEETRDEYRIKRKPAVLPGKGGCVAQQ